ncbi:MAG: hypothetical protein AAGI66_00400 [Cyanobacteria bacterium P01_H01_bin.74]
MGFPEGIILGSYLSRLLVTIKQWPCAMSETVLFAALTLMCVISLITAWVGEGIGNESMIRLAKFKAKASLVAVQKMK